MENLKFNYSKVKPEFKCDCCERVLTKDQMKIERKINNDLSPCYCSLIVKIDKLNKKVKKLNKSNSRYFSFLMEYDNLLSQFQEWDEYEDSPNP